MHGPFFHGQSTKKQFSVGNLKALKLTLRVFANDKWPTTSSRKLTVRLKKGTIGSSTKIQEWSQGRLSANDCHTGNVLKISKIEKLKSEESVHRVYGAL